MASTSVSLSSSVEKLEGSQKQSPVRWHRASSQLQLLSELWEQPQEPKIGRQSPSDVVINPGQLVICARWWRSPSFPHWLHCQPSLGAEQRPHLSLVEVEWGGKRMYWTTQVCFSLSLLLSPEPSIWRRNTAWALPSTPLHSTAPSPSSTNSGGKRKPVPTPRTPPAQHTTTTKQLSNCRWRQKNAQPTSCFTFSLCVSRVCARSRWQSLSQEGESTPEPAMRDCVHKRTVPRLTCMGSSSTMLIIPSPLDAKWKPSDRRTLATERKSDLQDFSTHTVSFKRKNDCTLHPKTPPFSRQGAAHREWGLHTENMTLPEQPVWRSAHSRHTNTSCRFACFPGHFLLFSSITAAELGKALTQVSLEAVYRTKTLCTAALTVTYNKASYI